jgi:enoyl-CoA hydratase/carnithine racemase
MTTVQVELNDGVRTVTLNRPEKRNALNGEMLELLHEAVTRLPAPEERVLVLRSVGQVFCSGIDLRERSAQNGPGTWRSIEPVVHAVEQYPLPVVAVVQGDAIAGGNELALHCDFVVAVDSARFGMSLVQIGLAPSWGLTRKLVEVAGPVTAREILLLGDPLSALRMHQLGLITRAVPADRLEGEVTAIVTRLAANAPLSLRAIKQTLLRSMAFRDGIDHAASDTLTAAARASDDAREGMAARLEKRPARFQGR